MNYKHLFTLLMVIAALDAFIPGLADPYVTPKILLAALAALPLLAYGESQSRLIPAMGLYLAAFTVSALRAQDGYYAMIGTRLNPFDSALGIGCYFAVLLAAAASEEGVDGMARLICWASLPMSAYAIAQHFVADPLLPAALPSGRVVSSQGGPVYLGAALAMVIACAAWLTRRKSALGSVALLLATIALWYTKTRGAMLAAAIGLAALAPIEIALGVGGMFVAACFRKHVMTSDLSRLEIFRMAWHVFKDFPFFGFGPGCYELASRKYMSWAFVEAAHSASHSQGSAHCDVLHVLATMGGVGLLAYAALGLAMLYVAWTHQDREERRLLQAALLCFFILAKLNPVGHGAMLILMLLIGAASASSRITLPRWIPAAGAILVVATALRLSLADYYLAEATRHPGDVLRQSQLLSDARGYNPWDAQIASMYSDAVSALLPVVANPQDVLLEANTISREQVRRHPHDAYAYELNGKNMILGYLGGMGYNPRAALAELDYAQLLAPTFKPIMLRRLGVASGLQLQDEVLAARADIAELDAHWGRKN